MSGPCARGLKMCDDAEQAQRIRGRKERVVGEKGIEFVLYSNQWSLQKHVNEVLYAKIVPRTLMSLNSNMCGVVFATYFRWAAYRDSYINTYIDEFSICR